eukprot:6374156-Prymnesium_polylepis.1
MLKRYDVLQHVSVGRDDQAGRRRLPTPTRGGAAYLLFAEGERAPLLYHPPLAPIAVTARASRTR